MKHVEITIKFTSPMLANSLHPEDGPDAVDTFRRDPTGAIMLQQNQIFAMLSVAKNLSGSSVRVGSINFNLGFTANTEVFHRRYTKDNMPLVRKHQSVAEGVSIALQMFIPDDTETDDVQKLFAVAGAYVGLSPYGHKLGYGRFVVTGVHELDVGVTKPAPVDGEIFRPGEKAGTR